jgi:hypothetical protein
MSRLRRRLSFDRFLARDATASAGIWADALKTRAEATLGKKIWPGGEILLDMVM